LQQWGGSGNPKILLPAGRQGTPGHARNDELYGDEKIEEGKMKKNILGLVMGFLMIGMNGYAADGDLIVNGSVGIGMTTETEPDRRLEVLDSSNPQMRLTNQDGSVYTDFQTTSNGYLYINPSGGRVGIGTSSPSFSLHIASGWTAIDTASDTNKPILLFRRSRGSITNPASLHSEDAIGQLLVSGYLGEGVGYDNTRRFLEVVASENWTDSAAGYRVGFFTRSNGTAGIPTERLRVDSNGDIGIGTSVFGTNAAKVLGIGNGTVPASSPADMIQLYAEEISGFSELKARDEAGNTPTLSPHNFTLFEPDSSYVYPWSYYSKNAYIGKQINVDMYGAIQAIEQLTGKKFIYVKDIPRESWGENQERIRLEREAEIKRLSDRIAELEAKIATLEGKDKESMIEEKNSINVPEPYQKKEAPKWLRDRMN
jgi:hypothetical protein